MKNYPSYFPVTFSKFLIIILLMIGNGLDAQTTIWKEDFNKYSNNTKSGNATGVSGSAWTSGNDVSVRSAVMESENEDENGYWRTAPINVRGFTDITLSFLVTHINVKGQDKFSFRYRLDGGTWIDLLGPLKSPGNNPGPNYSYSLPEGNTLELDALFKTKKDDRHYRLDDILLEGILPGCPNVLDYEFYDGVPPGFTVDNIPTTGALATGQIGNFNVGSLQNTVDLGDTDSFAIRYNGYIQIETAGSYTFYTTSDDGSKLYIDGNLVVNNDGDHSSQEISGTVTLTKGLHSIRVLYYENTGGEVLEVRYSRSSPSSFSRRDLPFTILSSDCVAPIVPPDPENQPPTIEALGDQSYCPGTDIPILESVSITDPDDTTIDKVFVQISSNYDNGKDQLVLNGAHTNITSSWNALEGKLTLTGPATFAAFEAALKAVVFNTTATMNGGDTRNFSIVLNEANYLISTGHYYEYVSALGITWTAARDAAAARKFYGLQGYLATITIMDEAALLGKQSLGAGWIGASDATTEGAAAEGQWRWVTGPEAGTQFWNGAGNGYVTGPFNYANWNNGEPNNSDTGGEHYAHINAPGTGFDGSWNDLSNVGSSGDYQPKGYLVEYGGMPGDPPYPQISAVTSITVNSVSIIAQPVDQIAIAGTTASFLVSANNADTYQWQVSTNGGTSFVNIADGTDYSGTQTNTLSIPNSNMAKNGHMYRVIVSNSSSDCPAITSNPAVLTIQVGTVITNKRITYRVKGN